MIADIESWLAGNRNFERGVELYERYGTNPALKILFASGASPFSTDKLFKELTALCIKAKPKSAPKVEKPKYTIDDLSPALQREFKRKGDLFKQASQMHSDLFHEQNQQRRADLVAGIKSCFDKIAAIWKKCDEYIRDRDNQDNTVSGLIQKRNNLRTRISKARKQELADKEQDLIAELKLVEAKLTTLENSVRNG